MSRCGVPARQDFTAGPLSHFHQSHSQFVLLSFMDFPLTRHHHHRHVFDVTFSFVSFSGILLLCQHHDCDELSTPSLASSSELETKDFTSTTTTVNSTSTTDHAVPQTRTSAISTTTTHTTRLHRITDAPSDETLIDATTSIDSLCLARTDDDNYSINSIDGDVISTIILHQADNATELIKFLVNHINAINLPVHNATIGELTADLRRHFH